MPCSVFAGGELCCMVLPEGLEPPRFSTQDPKSCASANSATGAWNSDKKPEVGRQEQTTECQLQVKKVQADPARTLRQGSHHRDFTKVSIRSRPSRMLSMLQAYDRRTCRSDPNEMPGTTATPSCLSRRSENVTESSPHAEMFGNT